MLARPALPPGWAWSRATTVITFSPAPSGTIALHWAKPLLVVAATPLTVTDATPEVVSVAVPVTAAVPKVV